MALFVTWIADSLSLWILDALYKNIYIPNFGTVLILALVIALINKTIKPLLKVMSLPISLVTFGLFALVINALMLELSFKLVPDAYIKGFWTAFGASIVLSLINSLVYKAFGIKK